MVQPTQSDDPKDILWDGKTLQEFFGVSRTTIERMVKRGELTPVRVGHNVRYWRSDVLAYIAKQNPEGDPK